MRIHRLAGISVCAIAMSAGMSLGAGAYEPPKDMTGMSDTAHNRGVVFVSGKKIHGMSVKNAEDKTLGTIDDMIIDRGSGMIRFLVLKSGSVMGLGGKLVTVPYGSFGWDAADKHVTLGATPEEIKGWAEFDKKRWMEGGKADSYIRTIGKDYYEMPNSPWPTEARGTASTVKGTVKTISRSSVDGGREELVVVVSSPDRPDREIVLGPSWYMAGNNSISFYRGAPVEIEVFQSDRAGRPVAIARSTKVNGQELAFYDSTGRAYWTPTTVVADRDVFSNAPFVLFTEIKGKPVDARGEKCGDVDDTIVDCMSGRTAFLCIDPDKNVLGIGDEDRLVPWTVMTRSLDGKVHLDASKAMITSAPTSPKDLKALGNEEMYRKVYGVYDVPPYSFDRNRR